jgi:hypothetical protein
MTPYWFSKKLPASRHGIENAIRLAFWAQGFGNTYFTCLNPEPPITCTGLWESSIPFNVEWVPGDYFTLNMQDPNKDILEAFERVLGHHATVGYRDASGQVVVEWRAKNPEARVRDLEASGAADLERLS